MMMMVMVLTTAAKRKMHKIRGHQKKTCSHHHGNINCEPKTRRRRNHFFLFAFLKCDRCQNGRFFHKPHIYMRSDNLLFWFSLINLLPFTLVNAYFLVNNYAIRCGCLRNSFFKNGTLHKFKTRLKYIFQNIFILQHWI